MQQIDALSYLRESTPIIDVRSPGEFNAGHIPGAVSLPLFSDSERARVGTAYKQVGRKEAMKIGLESVGPKLREFVEFAETLASPSLRLYCWRGGMRSGSMAMLLSQYGFSTTLLQGGYKEYRQYLREYFSKPLPLKVIAGYTGTGKTALLHALKEQGAQVVDLEGVAEHQGSSFGNQKSAGQPSTEHFHNLLFEEFMKCDLDRPIWVEDESMRIGDVNLPEELYRQMGSSPHVCIQSSLEDRIAHLIQDYEMLSSEQLIQATLNISKKLGGDRAKKAVSFIEDRNAHAAALEILPYYDKLYEKAMSKRRHLVEREYALENRDFKKLAKQLLSGGQ